MIPQVLTKALASAANATAIAQAQSTGLAFAINGGAASGGIATLDTQRRVLISADGDESAKTFLVVGTNDAGNRIMETVPGTNATTSTTNLDFRTVISVTPSAATASTVRIGTNGVGSSPWQILNWFVTPINVGFAVQVMSSTATFTVQHTYDDPNNLQGGAAYPLQFNHQTASAFSTNVDGSYVTAIAAVRVTINNGPGTIRFAMLQAGVTQGG